MEQDNKAKIFWLIALFLFLSAGILSFYGKDFIFKKRLEESKKISTTDKVTVPSSVAFLESQVGFQPKSLKDSNQIQVSELSREDSVFVVQGATDVLVNKYTYSDGKDGLAVSYSVKSDLLSLYNILRKVSDTFPYSVSFASRTNLAAIIVTEDGNREVKLTLKVLDDKTVTVEVVVQ